MSPFSECIFRIIVRLYTTIFGRPSMQRLNGAIGTLSARAAGFDNFGAFSRTGEEALLHVLEIQGARLCIDVGANRGEYTEEVLKRTTANVVAFEPLPGAYTALCALGERFPGRLTVVNEGVSDKAGVMTLYFGAEDSPLASFSAEGLAIGYVGAENTHALPTRVDTLDSHLSRARITGDIDLLKIDVEGLEWEVLSGARETIARGRPRFVQLEYGPHQLRRGRTLLDLASFLPGYALYQLLPGSTGFAARSAESAVANTFRYANFVFVRPGEKLA